MEVVIKVTIRVKSVDETPAAVQAAKLDALQQARIAINAAEAELTPPPAQKAVNITAEGSGKTEGTAVAEATENKPPRAPRAPKADK
jgi:hypothetical protein